MPFGPPTQSANEKKEIRGEKARLKSSIPNAPLKKHDVASAEVAVRKICQTAGARRVPSFPDEVHAATRHTCQPRSDGDQWLHELKFDGYRIIARSRAAKKFASSRETKTTGRTAFKQSPTPRRLRFKIRILDGEVVALDPRRLELPATAKLTQIRRHRFARLLRLRRAVSRRLRPDAKRRWSSAKKSLASVVLAANPDNDGLVRYSDHIQGQGESVLQHACRSAMEGIIAKRADSAYHQFRSPDWLKVKCHQAARVRHRRLLETRRHARRIRRTAAGIL